jgi:RecJ-like exonuclease
MYNAIEKAASNFNKETQDKEIKIISHYDTDGITSASIMIKALKRLDKRFSVKIIKQLESEALEFKENDVVLFLDLASSALNYLGKLKSKIYIIDHHEISQTIPENITIINPHLFGSEEISGAGLSYLFARALSQENKDLAGLAVIGMVGDMLDKNISKINKQILDEAEVIIKQGLLLYPATRPINKALEFSSSLFIPGVTGSQSGAISLLSEAGIEKSNGEYKNLVDLTPEEMSRLITAVVLRRMHKHNENILGNIYLVKFHGRLEDAREISAMINACSRLEQSDISLLLCLGKKDIRKKTEEIYASYKQHIVKALNHIESLRKIEGKEYVIINAKDSIKDTIIGTVTSILSNSPSYEEGTIIIGMAYNQEKIKVSARIAGRNGRNIREVLETVTRNIGGECGGHPLAAGCLINKENEDEFIKQIIKALEIEVVKI